MIAGRHHSGTGDGPPEHGWSRLAHGSLVSRRSSLALWQLYICSRTMARAAGLRALRGGCGRGFGCRCSRCCCWVWPDSAAGWPTSGRMTWPRMAWPLPAVSAFRAETCQRWRCCRQTQPHRRPHPRQPLRLTDLRHARRRASRAATHAAHADRCAAHRPAPPVAGVSIPRGHAPPTPTPPVAPTPRRR